MRLVRVHSQHGGEAVWKSRDEYSWLLSVFNAPEIEIGARAGKVVRAHVDAAFASRGWAMDCRIDPSTNLTITAKHRDLAFQVQTGNIGRAGYDLLKLQHMYVTRAISAVALALPTKEAAVAIGSNIANGDRVWTEAKLFDRQITVPLLIVEFE